MKATVNFFTNNLAGITGRIILTTYSIYVSFFSKRKAYAGMMNTIPVKREIILLKGQYASTCSAN